MSTRALTADRVFDGWQLRAGLAVALDGAQIVDLMPVAQAKARGVPVQDLGAGVLMPGMVDLQVNGGGGVLLGAGADVAMLARICDSHIGLGATLVLPTLITESPEVTQQVLDAGVAAARAGLAGFGGLHLEGPHLDPARKGAHDGALLRPMTEADLSALAGAAAALPALMVTLAPEAVTPGQIACLAAAGVIVSLGHTGCSADAARAAAAAGARCVTHLFNAMAPLTARAPGLTGAALTGPLQVGIIADGVHVAAECLRLALAMKEPEALFVVSDAMAVAGTDAQEFMLGGRRVLRHRGGGGGQLPGRLALEDGTLAGADVSLPQSVAHLAGLGVDLARVLAMVSRIPADVIGARTHGRLLAGARADLVHLDQDLRLAAVWCGGVRHG